MSEQNNSIIQRCASMAEVEELVRRLNALYEPPPGSAMFVPPEPYRDRTYADRIRLTERIRPKLKKQTLFDLIRNGGDIFGGFYADGLDFVAMSGTVEVPIGVDEPHWEPGHDQPGGGGGGQEGGEDGSDLVYIDIDRQDILDALLDELDLPFLKQKDAAKMLVHTIRIRGISTKGPWARLDEDATVEAWLERFQMMIRANPERFPGLNVNSVPTPQQFPFADEDLRFKKAEERWKPDSKAVMFMIMDTSGSMSGEPLAMAKLFFTLMLLWLLTKYEEVAIVFIAHNAVAERVKSAKDFLILDVAGGTMFVPAFQLTQKIANLEFPASGWNRYFSWGTDGYAFDPPAAIAEWMTTLIQDNFNFGAFLETNPYGGWGGWWTTPLQSAIALLSDPIRSRIGIAKCARMEQVRDAVVEIFKKADPQLKP